MTAVMLALSPDYWTVIVMPISGAKILFLHCLEGVDDGRNVCKGLPPG